MQSQRRTPTHFPAIVFLSCRVLTSVLAILRGGQEYVRSRDGNTFVWFLAGLGLGALAGVLYAPRSGSETREALRARAEEGRDYMRNRARDAKDQASQWADRGRDVVNQQKEQFRAAYEAGRQAYHEATTEAGTPKS